MTFAAEVLADSPHIWWDTRQASGTAQPDRSGNGHTGLIHGSPTLNSSTGIVFNNAATGDDQYIRGNDTLAAATVGHFAFEAVVTQDITKQPGGSTYSQVAIWDDATEVNTSGLNYQGTHGKTPEIDWHTATGFVGVQANEIADSSVHHIVGEYDGTNRNIYVDGTLIHTTAAGGADLVFDVAQTFIVAGDFCACGEGFGGLIRHAIFYTAALGASRVSAHATAALTDDPAGGAPTCSSVTPNHGYTTGGDSVVLAGTGFTDVSEVAFGGTPAAGFTVNSTTQITATTPPHAEGTVNVTVTTPGGTSA